MGDIRVSDVRFNMTLEKEDKLNGKVKKTCGAFLALLLIFTGCRARREAGMGAGPVRVVVSRVAPAETGREFTYSGTITESETLPQSFAVAGTVTRVYVNEGDVVAKVADRAVLGIGAGKHCAGFQIRKSVV